MVKSQKQKVALVQDWFTEFGGAEKVFQKIYELYPDADVFTLVYNKDVLAKLGIPESNVRSSFIQKLPFAKKKYRNYLPLFPFAIESLDLSSYDLIISSSYSVAKGVLTHANQTHICYCHSPVRYAWDLHRQYLKEANLETGIKGILAKYFLHQLRIWDIVSLNRVDHFISNSNYIARRIKKVYNREATTIYPPVAINHFNYNVPKEDFYFTCSRLVPYKKVDLIVKSFAKMPDKKLIVMGTGPDYDKIKKLAGPNVTMLGYQPFDTLKNYMERAKAFVFAAEEDFGILPVEAQAAGTPVIAFGKGGVTETIIEDKTGIFFYEQTIDAIIQAIKKYEAIQNSFDRELLRRHAESFNETIFIEKLQKFILEKQKPHC